MPERPAAPRDRFLRGGRVEDSAGFPETGADYRDMTPGQRMDALRGRLVGGRR